MSETMLVNVVNEEESRIAIISGSRLKELSVETAAHEQIEGNIYKAKVVKILPAIDAVFVDYGGQKNGFLSFPDIHPSYFEGGKGAEGLKRGQELLVQVRKGEIGQKGAALTTYVSIPGRYIVLMPLVNKKGVSRKIQDEDARRELKDLLRDSGLPDDMGYIVRTAGLEQNKQDLSRDVGYLLRLWKNIQSTAEKTKAPCLLYQESDIVIRTIRDYFTPSIQEVWVDNAETCEQVRAFFRTVMPWYQKRLKLYEDKAPLFAKFDVEGQLASIYEKTVPLPSGGSIVIEQTEALVSIDVNSGKTMKGKDIEETAFIANSEAAEEAARQLRLRDLGGLVVIDFIDMRSSSKRNEVRKILQKALKADKARTDVGTISKFGLLELSRQRIKPAGLAAATVCPACRGTGKVRSAESFALYVLRLVQAQLARGAAKGGPPEQVLVGVPIEAAALLVNRKRRALSDLEAGFSTTVAVFAEPALQANQYYIEYRRGGSPKVETNLPDDFSRALLKAPAGLSLAAPRIARPSAYALALELEDEPIPEVPEEPADEATGEPAEPRTAGEAAGEERAGKKRKRRRRKKKKGGVENGVPQETTESAPSDEEVEEEDEEPVAAAGTPAPAAAPEEKRLSASARRRQRRKRKKALGTGGAAAAEASAPEGAPGTEPAEEPPSPAEPPPAAEPSAPAELPAAEEEPKPKKPRRRGGRRKAEAVEAPAEAAAPPAPEPAPAVEEPSSDAAPAKPARKRPARPRRKKAEAGEAPA